MLAVWGQLSLLIALTFALIQGSARFLCPKKYAVYALPVPRLAAFSQCFWLINAFFALVFAFLQNDFTVLYVAANSHASLPFIYKLTAIWGGHEGSILLFVCALSAWGGIYAQYARREASMPRVTACLGALSSVFLLFLILASNPFTASAAPLMAQDLNPLLQDPGFILHPPLLYLGYVGFAVPFALAVCGGKENNQSVILSCIRCFALWSWSLLTVGITLGSIWAYHVLGWGGFWFWDPVENISLLPWISGLILIHLSILAKKNAAYVRHVMLWSTLAFASSVLGTFLVRSGMLMSVHSFAADPLRGVFLLIIFAFLLGAIVWVYLSTKTTAPVFFNGWDRTRLLQLQWMLAAVILMLIVFATLYPLLLNAWTSHFISVGAPYFNLVLPPFVFIMLFLMGLVPFSRYQQSGTAWQRWGGRFLLSFFLVSTFWFFYRWDGALYIYIAWVLGLFVVFSLSRSFRLYPAMSMAHLGFALLVVAIAGNALLSQEITVKLTPHEEVQLGPYRIYFAGTSLVEASNYRAIRAHLLVYKQERFITDLYPEKRLYSVRNILMTHTAIDADVFRDVYVALGEPLAKNAWSLRAYYKPMVRLVWLGAALMALGGLLAIFKKRRNKDETD